MKSSKFFTPPLSATDREQLFRCFGLDRFAFAYVEQVGKQVLQSLLVRDGQRQATLATLPPGMPVLIRRNEGQLVSRPAHETVGLWEDLFPYPFDRIGRWFREGTPEECRMEPASVVPPLFELWRALEALDERMKDAELTCLWLCHRSAGQQEEFPILCHYVRRRRLRLGNGSAWPSLVGLGELHRRGTLTPEVLRERFGTTRVAFHYLDSSEFLSDRPVVVEVTESLQRLLRALPPSNPQSPSPAAFSSIVPAAERPSFKI